MKSEHETAIPPAIASLLERARQRFRSATAQNRNDVSATMRDLLAQEGLDVNGHPLEQPDDRLPRVVTLGDLPSRRHRAEAPHDAVPDAPFDMEFNYRGSNGQLTRRRVSVWLSDAEYFAGHCHLRDGHRLFAWANVEGQVWLPDSGERVDVEAARGRFA